MKMKKILFFIQILFSTFCYAQIFKDFDFKAVSTDYNGLAFNGKAIVCYGTNGIITKSNDLGYSWTRVNLPDSFNIIQIEAYKNDFIGFTDNGYFITSTDNGNSWNIIKNSGQKIKRMVILNNGDIAALGINKLFFFNNDLSFKQEIDVTTLQNRFEICLVQNRFIIFPSGKGIIGIFDLNKSQTTYLNLKDLGVCDDCPEPRYLLPLPNGILFQLRNKLYHYDLDKVTFLTNLPVPCPLVLGDDGSVYCVYSIYESVFDTDSLYCFKVDLVNKKLIRLNNEGFDRQVYKVTLNSIQFLPPSILMATGTDNLILASRDLGASWSVLSYFKITDYTYLKFFGENEIRGNSNNLTFVRSSNGGATWLPPKRFGYSSLFKRFRGEALVFFPNEKYAYVFNNHIITNDDTNFVYSDDTCLTLKAKNVRDITYYSQRGSISFFTNGENLYVNYPSSFKGNYFSLLFILDFDLNYKKYVYFDSTRLLDVNLIDSNTFVGVCKKFTSKRNLFNVVKTNDAGNNWYEIYNFEVDSNLSIAEAKLYENLVFVSLYDSLSFKIYMFDYLNDKKQVLIDTNIQFGFMYFYKNKLFIPFDDLKTLKIYYLSKNFLDPKSKWELEPLPQILQNYQLYYFSERIISTTRKLAFIAKNWGARPNLFIATPKQIDNVEFEINKVTRDKYFLSEPYPNPSHEQTSFILWHPQSITSTDIKVQIYDYLGRELTNRFEITFQPYKEYTTLIKLFNKEQLNNNVLFLRITVDNQTKTQSFVIID